MKSSFLSSPRASPVHGREAVTGHRLHQTSSPRLPQGCNLHVSTLSTLRTHTPAPVCPGYPASPARDPAQHPRPQLLSCSRFPTSLREESQAPAGGITLHGRSVVLGLGGVGSGWAGDIGLGGESRWGAGVGDCHGLGTAMGRVQGDCPLPCAEVEEGWGGWEGGSGLWGGLLASRPSPTAGRLTA